MLVSGAARPISLEDMKENIIYAGSYNAEHETIRYFWEVLEEFSAEELQLLLKFITSCPRPPLLGFKELTPRLCIQAVQGENIHRLRTCLAFIKLISKYYSHCVNLRESSQITHLSKQGNAQTVRFLVH